MKRFRGKELKLTPGMEWIFVCILLAGGIFIRSFHFGAIPVGIHQDEAMAAVDALALAEHGTDRYGTRFPVHFEAWKGGQMSVLLSYCMIPFIKLFGFSAFSIRLPMLIMSCIGLLALYLFAREIGGAGLAFPVLILGIICPWHYIQSRWSFDCNTFPHVFLFGAAMLLFGMKKRWALYVSMVFFGLCSYCYGVANYSVPLFLLVMAAYLLLKKKVKWQEALLCVTIYFLVALPEFLTMLININGWESIETPFFTISYFPQSIRSKDILLLNFSWQALKDNLLKVLLLLLGRGQDTSITSVISKYGNLYPFTTVFFLIGLAAACGKVVKEKETEKKIPYVTLFAWLLMAVWAGAVTIGIAQHRINIIFYPMIVFSGMGMEWCIRKWKLLAVPIAGIYSAAAVSFAANYFGEYEELTRDYYYEPYLNALNYAETCECDYYSIFPDPQGTGISEVGRILTLFAHEIDAEYFQGVTDVQNGKKVLPYSERYRFETVTEEILRQDEGKNVVYVVGSGDIDLFSGEAYEIYSFYDSYYVAKKKGGS